MLIDYFQLNFQIFLIIFARIFGLFLTMPILSANVPMLFRAGLSFFIALLSSPMIISLKLVPSPADLAGFGLTTLSSFLLGTAIGFCVQIIVSAFQLSSAVFSTTMGLTISESLDPVSQIDLPAVGGILSLIMTMLFIRTESHIVLIEIIVRSFREAALLQEHSVKSLLPALKMASGMIFSLALRISMPIIGITLLLDIAMGLIGRVAPQFNVMIMGWNIKIIIGFGMLWMILPTLIDFGTLFLKELQESVQQFIRISGKIP